MDKMVRDYSCSRGTRRWPFRLFTNILDIACLNAYVVWLYKNPTWKKGKKSHRKLFILEVAKQFVTPHVKERIEPIASLHSHVIRAAACLGIQKDDRKEVQSRVAGRKRGRSQHCRVEKGCEN